MGGVLWSRHDWKYNVLDLTVYGRFTHLRTSGILENMTVNRPFLKIQTEIYSKCEAALIGGSVRYTADILLDLFLKTKNPPFNTCVIFKQVLPEAENTVRTVFISQTKKELQCQIIRYE